MIHMTVRWLVIIGCVWGLWTGQQRIMSCRGENCSGSWTDFINSQGDWRVDSWHESREACELAAKAIVDYQDEKYQEARQKAQAKGESTFEFTSLTATCEPVGSKPWETR